MKIAVLFDVCISKYLQLKEISECLHLRNRVLVSFRSFEQQNKEHPFVIICI